jgi:5'-3' exonuclease
MGVRNLNRFIQHKCPNASYRVHFRELSGKRIAVDTSIYMYRYSGEGALLENMYLMASVFRYYDIHAVFVFDGPPPPQKTEVIEIRKKKKEEAKKQYDSLLKMTKEKKDASGCEITTTELDDIEETMRELKKRFVRLRDCDVSSVKELLVSFGFATIDAEGEADALCAKLSIRKRVDACMSDDTDMFVYGCPVVLRNVSLLNHSVMRYDTVEIMKTLGLTQQEFKMMCVVCGTDYSSTTTTTTMTTKTDASLITQGFVSPDMVYKKLKKFKSLSSKEREKYHESGGGFYDWYSEQSVNPNSKKTEQRTIDASGSIISAITYISNEAMFDIIGSDGYKQLVVLNRQDIHRKRIIEIMMKEDFIFIESSPSDKDIIKSLSSGNGSLTSSPVYGIDQNPEKHANVIATEVYGINATSFEELHRFHKNKNKYLNEQGK